MSAVLDVVGWVSILLGAALSLVAAVGLLRFPDLLTRMHAAAKPQVLGVVLVAFGTALVVRDSGTTALMLLVVLAQLTTVPVAGHMLGRASYRAGQMRRDLLVVDDLTAADQAAERDSR